MPARVPRAEQRQRRSMLHLWRAAFWQQAVRDSYSVSAAATQQVRIRDIQSLQRHYDMVRRIWPVLQEAICK